MPEAPKTKYKISTIPIPMVDYAHYSSHELPQIQDRLSEIEAKYGNIMLAAQGVTKVPYDLILTMIYIESAGNPRAVSHAGAVGLMQLIPDTAVFVVAMENIKKRLSIYEQEWLRETIGSRLDCILKMPNLGTEVVCRGIRGNKFITQEDLFDPSFNILCGAIFLGILLDEAKDANGLYRIDKVVVRYNMGYNAMSKGKKLVGSPNQMVAKLSSEPAAYVKKLVGKNGLLTLV